MNAKTRQTLIAINRAFYAEVADAFSESRRDPWPGWRRALSHLRRPDDEQITVLDVGCGNGRFATFLEEQLGGRFRYLGVDSSSALLALAEGAHEHLAHVEFAQQEILDPSAQLAPAGAHFDLIVLYGVLHHIPGENGRREFVRGLIARLAEDGLLIVTAWQFGAFERFRSRILPWKQYNDRAVDPVDECELDQGDHLLRWGASAAPRYCHFTSPEELHELPGVELADWIDEYSADGKTGDLNRYAVLRRRSNRGA